MPVDSMATVVMPEVISQSALSACGMFHKITVLYLVLPWILTGETIGREQLAALGHVGLCRNCTPCIRFAVSVSKYSHSAEQRELAATWITTIFRTPAPTKAALCAVLFISL